MLASVRARLVICHALIFCFVVQLFGFSAGQVFAGPNEPTVPGQFHSIDVGATRPPVADPQEVLRAHLSLLHEKLATGAQWQHPLDWGRVLDQEAYEIPEANAIRLSRILVKVFDSSGNQLDAFKLTDMRLRGAHYHVPTASFKLFYQSPLTGEEKLIHDYRLDIQSIVFSQGYLFFLERDSHSQATSVSSVSYLDLNYFESALGHVEIPVFRLPLKTPDPIRSLSVDAEGRLKLEDLKLPLELVQVYSKIQQVASSLTMSLVDAGSYATAAEMVDELATYFDRAMHLVDNDLSEQEKRMLVGSEGEMGFLGLLQDHLGRLKVEANPKATKTFEHFAADHAKVFQETYKSMGANLKAQRGFMAKVGRVMGILALPKIKVGRIIKTSFVSLAKVAGVGLKTITMPLARHPAKTMIVAAAISAGFSQEITEVIVSGLQIGSQMMHSLWGAIDTYTPIGKVGTLAWDSLKMTGSFINPENVSAQFIENGRWMKTVTGVTALAGIFFVTIGLPHILCNAYKLVKDMKSIPKTEGKSWVKRFIERENLSEQGYLRSLGDSSYSGTRETPFTAQEEAEVERLVGELEQRDQSWMGAIVGKLKRMVGLNSTQSANKSERIESLAGAMAHFVFSYASLTNTGMYLLGDSWQVFFGFRNIVASPRLWLTSIYYPQYLGTILKGRNADPAAASAAMPTVWNGGREPIHRSLAHQLTRLVGSEYREHEALFEEKIFPIETAIQAAAMDRAFSEMMKRSDDLGELSEMASVGGVRNMGDDVLSRMSARSRTYFQLMFCRLFEGAMRRFIEKNLVDASAVENLSDVSDARLKAIAVEDRQRLEALTMTEALASDAIDGFLSENPHFVDEVKASAETMSISKVEDLYHMENLRKLDPKKARWIARMMTYLNQRENPQAIARAVRASMASFLVDKPLELFMLFICLAGVTEGINKPIYDEMFSENSFFYLGRYPFLAGFGLGVLIGFPSDYWFKVQQDSKNEGSFGNVPKDEDAKLSRLGWFAKNTFKNPQNSLLSNWAFLNKLIFSNMRAYLVMAMITNSLTLGRFDLDMFVIGYMFSYLTPIGAFAMKVEQGFELSAHYAAKDIPEELRTHPRAQKYLNAKIGRSRLVFNFWYKIYENFLGYWLGTMQTIPLKDVGPRGLLRSFFFGFTPTEIAVLGAGKLHDMVSNVPGVSGLTRGCKWLVKKAITGNYTDGVKLPKD